VSANGGLQEVRACETGFAEERLVQLTLGRRRVRWMVFFCHRGGTCGDMTPGGRRVAGGSGEGVHLARHALEERLEPPPVIRVTRQRRQARVNRSDRCACRTLHSNTLAITNRDPAQHNISGQTSPPRPNRRGPSSVRERGREKAAFALPAARTRTLAADQGAKKKAVDEELPERRRTAAAQQR
jgi:hypothetical protein